MGRPSKYNWEEIKKSYFIGRSVDYIVDKYGITKKTLQNKISEELWEVSGSIKSDILGLKQSIGKITDDISHNQHLAHIISEDVKDLINELSDLVDAKKIIYSATQLNLVRTMEYLSKNQKLEKINVGDGVQNFEPVGLGADDFKYCQDTIDKASITLGINPRHANTNIKVDNNNTQENNMPMQINIIRDN